MATAGTNVPLSSSHWYEIVNDTDDPIVVETVCELADSEGNTASEVRRESMAPQSDTTATQTLYLVAAYASPGPVTVTATTTLSGDVATSGSNMCTFSVSEDALFTTSLPVNASGPRRFHRVRRTHASPRNRRLASAAARRSRSLGSRARPLG
ncbi:hypothetical protein [Streptomyces sp. NBC_00102]|uniref:hypothetical protein n=1 Tax=Streptomyces sp. NBC_00102 TaxID=2975652 RepID=UPI00225A3E0A|nr:hypothetical protein [Streptomyces sp. NBC_00102]MCX5401774.1 hypothetical protein [Streptomyces sp. NBC_00102]